MANTVTETIEKGTQEVKHAGQAVTNEVKAEVQTAVNKDVDSTDTNLRYAAYLRRIRDIARAGSRYTAYTSDIGEAFRPVVPPYLVTAAYGVSWAYLIGDVAFTTYKAKEAGPTPIEAANFSEPTRLTMVAVKRSVFQSVASMALPAFTIHTAVRQASKMVAKSSNITLKRWGPTAVGISIVPALPFLFDHPVEIAVDSIFDKIEEALEKKPAGGAAAPPAGKTEL